MKNQTTKILVAIFIMGIVLLFSGCPADPSQNNSNQNTADQNASEDENSSKTEAPPPVCTSVSEQDIADEVSTLPNPLKQQFDNGNITWSYDPQNHDLIFKGYIYGNGVNLRALLNRFNRFRGEQCLWKIIFQGQTSAGNFEWRPDPASPTPTPPEVCDVSNTINNSNLASQLNQNLFENYNPSNRVLTLTGYIGDIPPGNKFNAFIGLLQRYMRNGCITKIVFGPRINNGENRVLLNSGFGWQICEHPTCECNGICETVCPCARNVGTNSNTNSNTSGNTSNSNTP